MLYTVYVQCPHIQIYSLPVPKKELDLRRSYSHCTECSLFDEANRNTSVSEHKSDLSVKTIVLLGCFLIPPVLALFCWNPILLQSEAAGFLLYFSYLFNCTCSRLVQITNCSVVFCFHNNAQFLFTVTGFSKQPLDAVLFTQWRTEATLSVSDLVYCEDNKTQDRQAGPDIILQMNSKS